jgi:hypothetical protein
MRTAAKEALTWAALGLLAKLVDHCSIEARVLESREGYTVGLTSPPPPGVRLWGKFPLAR